ncbi:MAG TPA: hypothetical protein VES68_03065 [Candidatus Sulfotelmatobacter sp.]|nr:hypothetical protein [Candidatus Sulfotelmatobacter sp.]
MPDQVQSDINFQPKTEGYSFSSDSQPKKPSKLLSTFITLLFGIFAFLFIFLLVLGVLNYFKLLSLSKLSPVANKLPVAPTPIPTPIYDKESQSYSLEGTLYEYNDYTVKVKYYNQIKTFIFDPNKSFYAIQNDSKDTTATRSAGVQNIGVFSDLENEKNIGKQVTVDYTIDNQGKSIIQQIVLLL